MQRRRRVKNLCATPACIRKCSRLESLLIDGNTVELQSEQGSDRFDACIRDSLRDNDVAGPGSGCKDHVHPMLYARTDHNVMPGRVETLSADPAGCSGAVLGDTRGVLLAIEQLGDARRVAEYSQEGPDAAITLIAVDEVSAEID